MTPDRWTMPSRPGWLSVFGVIGHHRLTAATPHTGEQAAHGSYGFVQMLYESPRGHPARAIN
jgi:hypothetical protein